jgi:hypothetical protein
MIARLSKGPVERMDADAERTGCAGRGGEEASSLLPCHDRRQAARSHEDTKSGWSIRLSDGWRLI